MSFSFQDRKENIVRLQKEIFDLVIIGGGITGAGVARDAASRGMKVALIEAKDFAFGTSSRSSKLIHGGLRYLENLEFHLVFEALSERRILMEIAPHLVRPLKFFIPVYKNSRVGMFKLGLGMWLYDFLSQFEAPEIHQRYDAASTLNEVPILNPNGLVGSFSYFDAYMDDDRLVLETLRSAHQLGAVAINYARAGEPVFDQGKMIAVKVHLAFGGGEFLLKGRHFLSATGPWTDTFGRQILTDWRRLLRPTKGIHFTLSKSRLPIESAVVMSDDEKKRIVFVIPRYDMVIVGTTDTDYSGDPSNVEAQDEDIHYLLNLLAEYFPGARIQKTDILATYAGVRPLVDDGAATEGQTSREHILVRDPRNITFVAGGKFTTYRKMAEDITNSILRDFNFEDQVRLSQSHTKTPLNSRVKAHEFENLLQRVEDIAKEYRRPVHEIKFLLWRHGAEAFDILAKYGRDRSIWELEAYHAIFETMCLSVTDFLHRRVPLFLATSDHGKKHLPEIEQIFRLFNLSNA